jgi:hypothetical protein
MGRKSTIDKLEPEVRTHIEKRLRENRLTLDELILDLQTQFPGEEKPSRSAIGRYRQGFNELRKKMMEQDALSRALVEELGENPDDKAGALMMQSVTTLMNHVTMNAQEDPELAIDDVRKLARAAKDVIAARTLSRQERVQIRRDAQAEQLKEQEARLEEMRGTDGMSTQMEDRIRGILLGKA